MKPTFNDLLAAFEVHSVERIRAILDAGFDLGVTVAGKSPINYLIEMYFRSDRFPDCLHLLIERGAVLDDPKIESVLLNDPDALALAVQSDPKLMEHRTSLPCAFTPLSGATLLHVAAEYGHLAVTRKLLDLGAQVDERAAVDEFAMNGHTPLFHAVNSNGNRSLPVLRLLLDAGASPTVLIPGVTWGKGFDWETVCFDVTPISYTQLGLLPQFHRTEQATYENVKLLLRAAGRIAPPLKNVPNRYLGDR